MAFLCVSLLAAAPGVAAERKDARKVYEEATAAFGLGRYADAAEKYEQAFSMRPDPAFLYNAAQSYRLAGNKPRALELYKNCLRLYPDFANAEDARNHVAVLKKQIDDEKAAAAASPGVKPPPVTAPSAPPLVPTPVTKPATRAPVAPSPVTRPAPAPGVPAPPPASAPPPAMPPPTATMPPPVLTAPPPAVSGPAPLVGDSAAPAASIAATAPAEEKSLTSQTWFWVTIGAVVVAAGAVAVVLATRGGESYPAATFGTVPGN